MKYPGSNFSKRIPGQPGKSNIVVATCKYLSKLLVIPAIIKIDTLISVCSKGDGCHVFQRKSKSKNQP